MENAIDTQNLTACATKSLSRIWAIALVSLLVGAICGAIGGGYYGFMHGAETTSAMAMRNAYGNSILQLRRTASLLIEMKAERTGNALAQLDRQLDFDLSELAVLRKAAASTECETGLVKAISMARAYRDKYPSTKSGSPIAANAQEALRICGERSTP